MKIFVTGGTGFIGSHFINQAHAAGHEVVALRWSSNSRPRVALTSDPLWVDKLISEVSPDDLAECDAIVHLAAHSANVPYDSLDVCILQNVLAPLALFNSAISAGIRRFIVAGSCFEYGISGEKYEFIPTDACLEPTLSYPASKAAASVAFQALAREKQLELLILRIFQVYGEGEAETRFWPSLRHAATHGQDFPMSAGNQVRDFINVTEVASSFVSALDRSDIVSGKPVIENLGSGTPQTLAAFAEKEWTRFGATGKLLVGALPMRSNEVMRFVPLLPT